MLPADDLLEQIAPPALALAQCLSDFRIENRHGVKPAHERALRLPEIAEDVDDPAHGALGVRLPKRLLQLAHLRACREIVEERFEQLCLRFELIIDGHAGNVGTLRDRIVAEGGHARILEELARRRDDARTRRLGRSFPALAGLVGPRAHAAMFAEAWALTF